MNVSAIVAMTPEGLIGRGNTLPWHLPEDLKHFKATTKGHACLMGRSTWDGLPGALPGRTNLVVSRRATSGEERDGARWFASLDDAARWAAGRDGELFVCGGAEVFRAALAGEVPGLRPERLIVTWVPSQPIEEGDVRFPYDEAWIDAHFEAERRWTNADESLRFVVYARRG